MSLDDLGAGLALGRDDALHFISELKAFGIKILGGGI